MIPGALLASGRSRGSVWRIIESQEQAATRSITRSAHEQSRLEELLDGNKPAYRPGTEHLHWLLRSPFRYPPLRHGSRFGTTLQPGILYASRELRTAMTESAVYLWLFRSGPLTTGPLQRIEDGRTALHFDIAHASCSDLTRPAAQPYRAKVSDPASYHFSQPLGDALRAAGVTTIWFHSARDPAGVNAAVMDPAALTDLGEPAQQHWQLQLDASTCWWGRPGSDSFEISLDSVSDTDGKIPHPAL